MDVENPAFRLYPIVNVTIGLASCWGHYRRKNSPETAMCFEYKVS